MSANEIRYMTTMARTPTYISIVGAAYWVFRPDMEEWGPLMAVLDVMGPERSRSYIVDGKRETVHHYEMTDEEWWALLHSIRKELAR